ncbi:MAG TPA: hypothetical protein EYH50_00595 [Pyrodictium delaneyi]|uniref:Uncharacterized protein n=1 Tax=Pyrodictium delaneyi TaxID=1273541 RepID=A0A832ZTG1_9CREN|nr:hypothetical protein [Pyrodictium delaneyi]
MEILTTVFILAVILLFIIVMVLIIIAVSRSKQAKESENEDLAYGSEEETEILPFGSGGTVANVGETGGWLSEAAASSGTGRRVDEAVESRLLLVLDKYRAVPIEELELRIGASREEIMRALHKLEERGLVRVEGGMLIFSERGEKLITKLREKYFDKRRWLESI